MRLAVLLPCYNEEAAIGDTVAAFRAALPDAVVYVYDNNSSDGTVAAARAAGAVVRSERMQGKGHVVRRMLAPVAAAVVGMAGGGAPGGPPCPRRPRPARAATRCSGACTRCGRRH